jgi:hypothetical protein
MPHEARVSGFEMLVKDVFAFEDGRTIFAGEITIGPNYIRACDCELLIGEAPVARFRIEDEMMPLRKTRKNLRSIATTEKVDLTLIGRLQQHCKLRGV